MGVRFGPFGIDSPTSQELFFGSLDQMAKKMEVLLVWSPGKGAERRGERGKGAKKTSFAWLDDLLWVHWPRRHRVTGGTTVGAQIAEGRH